MRRGDDASRAAGRAARRAFARSATPCEKGVRAELVGIDRPRERLARRLERSRATSPCLGASRAPAASRPRFARARTDCTTSGAPARSSRARAVASAAATHPEGSHRRPSACAALAGRPAAREEVDDEPSRRPRARHDAVEQRARLLRREARALLGARVAERRHVGPQRVDAPLAADAPSRSSRGSTSCRPCRSPCDARAPRASSCDRRVGVVAARRGGERAPLLVVANRLSGSMGSRRVGGTSRATPRARRRRPACRAFARTAGSWPGVRGSARVARQSRSRTRRVRGSRRAARGRGTPSASRGATQIVPSARGGTPARGAEARACRGSAHVSSCPRTPRAAGRGRRPCRRAAPRAPQIAPMRTVDRRRR